MFPTSFTYHRATNVADAIAVLGENPEAKILAGGHSLIPAMKLRLAAPEMLVDITHIPGLRSIEIGDDIRIGAMATYNEIRDNKELAALLPILPEAIRIIGDQQVRSRGTFGGSVAHADPAADLTAVFVALDGRVKASGPDGEREIAADDFFVDLWTTALEPTEVVTELIIPKPAPGTRMKYLKHAHPASGYAVVGVAVVLPESGGSVENARVVLTGATSKPTRITAVEDALNGSPLTDDAITSAVSGAAAGVEINGDAYASEAFRAHLVEVMLRRALHQAAE